jgi:hypothetical protein
VVDSEQSKLLTTMVSRILEPGYPSSRIIPSCISDSLPAARATNYLGSQSQVTHRPASSHHSYLTPFLQLEYLLPRPLGRRRFHQGWSPPWRLSLPQHLTDISIISCSHCEHVHCLCYWRALIIILMDALMQRTCR